MRGSNVLNRNSHGITMSAPRQRERCLKRSFTITIIFDDQGKSSLKGILRYATTEATCAGAPDEFVEVKTTRLPPNPAEMYLIENRECELGWVAFNVCSARNSPLCTSEDPARVTVVY